MSWNFTQECLCHTQYFRWSAGTDRRSRNLPSVRSILRHSNDFPARCVEEPGSHFQKGSSRCNSPRVPAFSHSFTEMSAVFSRSLNLSCPKELSTRRSHVSKKPRIAERLFESSMTKEDGWPSGNTA